MQNMPLSEGKVALSHKPKSEYKVSNTKKAKKHPVVRAIDVGFGVVKFTTDAGEGKIECQKFPSMAIPSDPSELELRNAAGGRSRDTVDVPVDGVMYEVGRDIHLSQTGNDFGREITDNYYRSATYKALMKGALRYMNDPVIDMLVLGLPVNQYQNSNRAQELVETYKAEGIDLGSDEHGNPIKVTIRDVVVRPQPVGGYLEMLQQIDVLNEAIRASGSDLDPIKDPDDIIGMNVLVVDPGEHTLDWLLVQNGDTHPKASGAASDGGRHRVVRAVFASLEAKLGRPLDAYLLPRINDALRAGKQFRYEGRAYDLREFESVIRATIKDPVNRLVEGTRAMMSTVDIIVMIGGHPDYYRDEIASRYPQIPVAILKNSIEANVRGFQFVGEEIMHRQGSQAA